MGIINRKRLMSEETITPETDKEEWHLSRKMTVFQAEFARELEIERNEALARCERMDKAIRLFAEMRQWLAMDKYIAGYMMAEKENLDAIESARIDPSLIQHNA